MDFVDPTDRAVLQVLLRSEVGLSGRAIARVTGLSQSSAQRALVRLRDRGVVLTTDVPPSLLYRINPDHVAMPALIELLALPEQIRARAAEQVASWRVQPVSAVLCGSVAHGDAHAGSDVDMLVVRPSRTRADQPVWEEQVATLSAALQRWTGLPASIIELTATDVRRGLHDGEAYLLDAADGLMVAGQPLRELGRRAG